MARAVKNEFSLLAQVPSRPRYSIILARSSLGKVAIVFLRLQRFRIVTFKFRLLIDQHTNFVLDCRIQMAYVCGAHVVHMLI